MRGDGTPIRIADVRVRILSAPTDEPIVMSFGVLPGRSMAVVEVESADGVVGRGESWINWPAWAGVERRATLLQGVAPLLVGRDASDVAGLHRRMTTTLAPLGRQWGAPGPIMQAISGADLALWDLVGKVRGLPVAELLGGSVRTEVAVYASGLGPRGAGEQVERSRAQGFTAVKVKVGFGAAVDCANLRDARSALGASGDLMADANKGWTLEEAVAMGPALHDCGVLWVEEPVRDNALADLEAFYRRTGVPVATGENLYGRDGFVAVPMSPIYVPMDEDHPLVPMDHYGLSKQLAELTAAMFGRGDPDQAITMVRFPWIIAPEEIRQRAATATAQPERFAHLLWNYIDVRDAARACPPVASSPYRGGRGRACQRCRDALRPADR